MKRFALMLLLAATPALAETPVHDISYKDDSGARVLSEWIVVDAPRSAVWDAFTTDAGFVRWAAPFAHVVPGNGGTIEFGVSLQGKIGDPANVRQRIDIYEPNRLLVFHNEYVPAGAPFDAAAFASVRTMLSFQDAGQGQTKVTETVIGFGTTAAYDDLYRHLHDGNAEYLEDLAKNFQKTK